MALASRAPIFLRVNSQKISRLQAIDKLCDEGIVCDAHPDVPSALIVKAGQRSGEISKLFGGFCRITRRVQSAKRLSYSENDLWPFSGLLCGAGGKTLALADHFKECIYAHDRIPNRLRPLEHAQLRAKVMLINTNSLKREHYGLVFADVPCSGSGTWRRDPTGKWRLHADELKELIATQYSILTKQNITSDVVDLWSMRHVRF